MENVTLTGAKHQSNSNSDAPGNLANTYVTVALLASILLVEGIGRLVPSITPVHSTNYFSGALSCICIFAIYVARTSKLRAAGTIALPIFAIFYRLPGYWLSGDWAIGDVARLALAFLPILLLVVYVSSPTQRCSEAARMRIVVLVMASTMAYHLIVLPTVMGDKLYEPDRFFFWKY